LRLVRKSFKVRCADVAQENFPVWSLVSVPKMGIGDDDLLR